ncbi:MAG: hypothetical protein QG636_598 [Patescibacteria group bacterium]|nr:hypothetical protein [Patescibacteria group bacterium]
MVDTPALGAGPFGGGGSSPLSSTTTKPLLDFLSTLVVYYIQTPFLVSKVFGIIPTTREP